MVWYRDQLGKEYRLQDELERYCIADVNVLRHACIQFRNLMLEIAEIDPFRESVTLAGIALLNFRANHLRSGMLGLFPQGGYFHAENQSKVAMEWLQFESERRGIAIHTVATGREVKRGRYKLDGYYHDGREEWAFEFQGCFYHGHPECQKYNRQADIGGVRGDTLHARYQRTLDKVEFLERSGMRVVQKWQCEWDRQNQEDPEVRAFMAQLPSSPVPPLDPREAFFGGRTNNCKKHYQVRDGEQIRYIDICSLYPYINKFGKYPLRAPRRCVGPQCPHPNDFEGLIQCAILPNRALYHPVLPMRIRDKLMFVLCHACAQAGQQEACHHTRDERKLVGCWVVDEVRAALQKGYQLLETYECWVYDEVTQYDPKNEDPLCEEKQGLFASYVNANLKLKMEASGWPAQADTDEKRAAFVAAMRASGVDLDPSKVKYNAGLRTIAKLLLNSLWGRLVMRPNLKQHVFVSDVHVHYQLLTDPGKEIVSVLPVNEEVELVCYQYKAPAIPFSKKTNVVVGAYTTAQARLKLYTYLDRLGEDVLYFDTDSVIFVQRPGQEEIPCGQSLGDMTNELDSFGPGSYISEFVSGGPKVYGLKICKGGNPEDITYILKIKGVSMNSGNADLVNFNTLKELVLGERPPLMIVSHRDIRRAAHFKVVSRDTHKTLRAV